jgi:hypothetical protein
MLSSAVAAANPPEEDILRPYVPIEGRFFFQGDLGVNANWFDGNPIFRAFFRSETEAPMYRSAVGFGALGAVSVGYTIGTSLRLRLRAAYDVRSADEQDVVIDSCPTIDPRAVNPFGNVPVAVDKRYSVSISYLTLGLTAEYLLERFFLFAGPAYGLPVEREFVETDQLLDGESACVYFPHTPDTARRIEARITGTDSVRARWSVRLGAGYIFGITPQLSLVPELAIDLPFSGILEAEQEFPFSPAGGEGGRNRKTSLNEQAIIRTLQATVGLRFTF